MKVNAYAKNRNYPAIFTYVADVGGNCAPGGLGADCKLGLAIVRLRVPEPPGA